MADREALRDAERLLAKADSLADAIDREIAEMEAALRGAQEGISRTEAIACETGDHVCWLGDQLDVSQELQRKVSTNLTDIAGLERRLRSHIGAETARMPTLVVPSADSPPLRVAAALPVFQRTPRAELEKVELLAAATHPEAWNRVAEDYPSLGDLLESAHKHLEEAQKLAEDRQARAERFRRQEARRTPSRAIESGESP